jgi:metal-responsive CopG/Arc/MetJ family transcriptional regulator
MAIRDYFPKREKMVTLQVKMPEALLQQVQSAMKEDNYETWREFLTACFKFYLETRNEESSGEKKETSD